MVDGSWKDTLARAERLEAEVTDLRARLEDEREDAAMERKGRFRRWVLRTFRVEVKR